MEKSPNHQLPYIMPLQSQSHVTHNEAIRRLDCLTLLTVRDRTRQTPPAAPADGDRHIVGAGALSSWAGRDGQVAAYQDDAWVFYPPAEGWIAWCIDDDALLVSDGATWQPYGSSGGALESVPSLGINAQADAANRLTVSAVSTLLNHEGSDHRLVVNKAAGGDTASLVFQSAFSGRAEMGLAGDENFAVKVSPDGTSFLTALAVDSASGQVALPHTNILSEFALNLYQDSGRFAGAGQSGIGIGGFVFPAYLTLYNGASAAGHGQFVHNNATHGGARDSLTAEVNDLVSKIREPGHPRRYGNEFWVAQLTAGSGQSGAYSHAGLTGHALVFNTQMIRAPAMTYHVYVRALDAPVLIRQYAGQTIYIDGAGQAGAGRIDPADGWRALMIHDLQNPRQTVGYQPVTFDLYATEPGGRYLLACAALLPGITRVDPDIGLIAALTSWT